MARLMDRDTYKRFADAHAPRSPILKNCINAYWIGGLICVLGEALKTLYAQVCGMNAEDSATLVSVTLVFCFYDDFCQIRLQKCQSLLLKYFMKCDRIK